MGKGKDTYWLLIYFKHAFDSVWRISLETLLRYYGMKEVIVQFIGKVNRETRAVVRKGKNMKKILYKERRAAGMPTIPTFI